MKRKTTADKEHNSARSIEKEMPHLLNQGVSFDDLEIRRYAQLEDQILEIIDKIQEWIPKKLLGK